MELEQLNLYKKVQDAARATLDKITEFVKPGISEAELIEKCDELQRALGVDSYWYKSLPALVLIGNHTNLAISRESYIPSDLRVGNTDLVTIDLNPSIDGYIGDYARSYYIEEGEVSRHPKQDIEFLAGFNAQEGLHSLLRKSAYPDMTFDELYQIINKEIEQLGFEQLDYLGHGVRKDMSQLEFIAPGVMCTLREVGLFTLEPQIRLKHGNYGFKHENIYYFQDQLLREL